MIDSVILESRTAKYAIPNFITFVSTTYCLHFFIKRSRRAHIALDSTKCIGNEAKMKRAKIERTQN